MAIPAGVRPLTVTHLTNVVKLRLEEHFATVWVTGEVSNFTRAASGHYYFTLKDAGAQLKCVMWRSFALRLRFDPVDGLSIIARGSVTVYPTKGEYQLVLEELHPKGIGAAELSLRQLKERLLGKGYFDPRRKRPLPKYPRRVALIASLAGATIRDMVELLSQRWPLTQVVVRSSLVQGDGAAASVAANIRFLCRFHDSKHLPLCAIILCRGGGSSEDLGAFNEEMVADAIFQSSVPIISAIGHETDVTIADLVADLRAETPSAAVTALTPDRTKMLADLTAAHGRLQNAVTSRIRLARQRVDQLAQRPAVRKPLERIRDLEQHLDRSAERLHRAATQCVKQAKDRLAARSEHLEGLSPLQVLHRGYSLTQRGDGTIVRAADDVASGEVLITKLSKGEIRSRVIGTTTPDEEQP